jgi:hypothetical protein
VRPSGPASFALNVWTLLSRCTECAEEVALQNICKTNAGMQCVSAAYHTMPTGHAVTICSALKASSKRGNADPAHRTHELNRDARTPLAAMPAHRIALRQCGVRAA